MKYTEVSPNPSDIYDIAGAREILSHERAESRDFSKN